MSDEGEEQHDQSRKSERTSERHDPPQSMSYKRAGVDIAAADAFVETIGAFAKATHNAGVVKHTTAYAGLFRPDLNGIAKPLLSAATDGVGTKLLVAREMKSFEGLGQDLVAMNVNDLLPSGSRPLLFLDYIATGKLEPDELLPIVRGIANACKEVGCVLLGGETAEMPGVYQSGDFDLAGFAVGLADEARLPDATTVREGDVLFALPSSGMHANGFSLARKALLEMGGLRLTDHVGALERSLGEELLEPTRLYVNPVLEVMKAFRIKGSAHITGGGLLGRLAKLVGDDLRVDVDPERYRVPPVFALVQKTGNVAWREMASTFNMGLGYVVVVDKNEAERFRGSLMAKHGWLEVGNIARGTHGVDLGYAAS
ncbi:MAG: phosphoribosylformylglycinamidine cyclo-ligase [Clostridia bacterium]|nr:phosphoribosylformylglycinamidine cyclo-ligase [Deltaproteobacteria bacterium]